MSNQSMVVPFGDLRLQYLSIQAEIDKAIADVIDASAFIRGPFVQKFEEEFARLMEAEHCVSCANGTDSLYIAMHALGVKPGDEIIAPAHSWISTSETITQAGATVVFCDTDPVTFTIDPQKIADKITSRTVGIIPVHLYGQPADMNPIMEIAKLHGLWIIEDCAQAHMARYQGRLVGSFGSFASFSFYPGKNLGAMGDAGALTTSDAVLAQKAARFARHGGLTKGDHQIEGINSRLDGIQAAILLAKLNHLPSWTKRRQELTVEYGKLLSDVKGLVLPKVADGREHVWHLYVVQHDHRDQLARHLMAHGVQTAVNYPVALPFLPAYERFAHQPADFPSAFGHQSKILSLPLYPEMTSKQVEYVASAIKSFSI